MYYLFEKLLLLNILLRLINSTDLEMGCHKSCGAPGGVISKVIVCVISRGVLSFCKM